MRSALRVAALAVAAAGIGGWLLLRGAGAGPGEAPEDTPDNAGASITSAAATQRGAPDYFAFVPSMLGTRPDGAARANATGRLDVNAELAYLFDYYLAGLGERPLEAIRAEIIRELDRRLPATAAAEARRLLDAYLAYKRALVDLERGLPPQTDPVLRARQRLAAMQQLRSSYFSEQEIGGLFSTADAYDQDAIARLAIASDTSLNEAQRQQQLAALDAALPAAARAEKDAPTRVLRLEEAVNAARAHGAGDNEIYRLRAAALSPSAAARLADVDREEADWQRRINTYQSQRRQLPQDAASLQQLRDSIFSAAEQKRLPAYE